MILAALSITTHVLMNGGKFVAKIFRGKDTSLLYAQLRIFFKRVSIAKPASSRNSSIEAFVVCEDYSPPEGYVPQMVNPMVDDVQLIACETESEVNRSIIPFVVCGDLRGFDSDMSYSLKVSLVFSPSYSSFNCNSSPNQLDDDKEYEFREVIQKPIAPAYKEILEKTKNISLKHQGYVLKEETPDGGK